MRKAKIIGTLGPSSNDVETIKKLIKAGINVARVNMSHGTHEEAKKLIENIREASKSIGQEVAILADLQGPKIRVDKLNEPLKLKKGETWVIGPAKVRDNYKQYDNFIPTLYEKLVEDCHDGARILFDDGLIAAEALEKDGEVYKINILVGGILKSNKGINLPDCQVSAPAMTEKDRKDLFFALKHDVDYVALSFVRTKEDIKELKCLLHDLKMNIPVVAKIEKPQAVENLSEIMEATDVIMIARGDLGVEVGNHLVPSIQKLITKKCNEKGIPVITATQMLESMIVNPTPTRAEASDVANAIWDGTDAVMLSGESASGKYPVESVKMMSKIITDAEKTPAKRQNLKDMDLSNLNSALSVAASVVAEKVHAKRIIAMTQSGHSCLKLSRFRPITQVLGITNNLNTVRRICLYWGVQPHLIADYDEDSPILKEHILDMVRENVHLKKGDKVVIARGDGTFFAGGMANSVQVEAIRREPKVTGASDTIQSVSDGKKTIKLDTHVCASCQNCVSICPHDIWAVKEGKRGSTYIVEANVVNCAVDLECVKVCPTGAIEIIPEED
jgi:pyruvate kinase